MIWRVFRLHRRLTLSPRRCSALLSRDALFRQSKPRHDAATLTRAALLSRLFTPPRMVTAVLVFACWW